VTSAIYGELPPDLEEAPSEAMRLGPRIPGGSDLEDAPDGALSLLLVHAPEGTLERRAVLAQGLRALRPGGRLVAFAHKTRGGGRLKAELTEFGCLVAEEGRRHFRVCRLGRPQTIAGMDEAIREGGLQMTEAGLWSQPGVFSWNRLDPGSACLMRVLPELDGEGADLGAGVGSLAGAVLASPGVRRLTLVEIDRRALRAARMNLPDGRAVFIHGDALSPGVCPSGLDFVVMNPPFHAAGVQDHGLGGAFIRAAAGALRKGGVLWMTANRHLPYEAVIDDCFAQRRTHAEIDGFKVIEARR